MKKLTIAILLFVACAPARQLTNDERAYRDRAYAQPTTFMVHKDHSKEAWGRGQAFVAEHSSMKIQTATDFVFETYTPFEAGQYGYSMSMAPIGDSCQFKVKSLYNTYSLDLAVLNGHLCAYYMVTGQEPPIYLVSQ